MSLQIDDTAAARMDRVYRHQRHIYDLTRKYYLLGRDRLIVGLAPKPGDRVLEIGCGTGRNLVAVARRYPGARLYGIDISSEMLDQAAGTIQRGDLTRRITLAQADATRFSPARLFDGRPFERVFLSYTLSMIPDWRSALDCAAAALAPGGSLHIVDFGQQAGLPRWFHRLLFAWLARFHVHPSREFEQVMAEVAAAKGLTLTFRPLYRDYAIEAVMTRR